MSKFNYVTGYLPYVIDEEIHRKKIKQRLIFGITAITAVLLSLSLLGNGTSAENNHSRPPQQIVKLEKGVSVKNKQATLLQTPSTIQTSQNLSSLKSDKQLEAVYQKEIEDILNKAFSQ